MMHHIAALAVVLVLSSFAGPAPAAENPGFPLPPELLAPSWPGADHLDAPLDGFFGEFTGPLAHLAGHLEVIGSTGQSMGPYDQAGRLARAPDGSYYVAGWTYTGVSTNRYEMLLGKWASNGQAVWVRTFNTATYEWAYGVAVDPDGNAVLAGWRAGTNGTYQPVVAKFAPDGTYLWSRVMSTNLSYLGVAGVAVAPDGTIAIAGYGLRANSWRYVPFVATLTAGGQVGSFRQLDAAVEEVAVDVAFDGEGNLLVVGTSYGNAYDTVLTKLSPAGAVLARTTFDAGTYETGAAVEVDGAGNVLVAGSVSGGRVFVARTNAALTQEWLSVLYPGAYSYASDLAVDTLGNVVVSGQTYAGHGSDILVVKFLASGAPLFARAIDRSDYDQAGGVATSPLGTEVITGGTSYNSYASGSGADLTLVRSLGFSVLGTPAALLSAAPQPDLGDSAVPLPPLP